MLVRASMLVYVYLLAYAFVCATSRNLQKTIRKFAALSFDKLLSEDDTLLNIRAVGEKFTKPHANNETSDQPMFKYNLFRIFSST